MNVTENTMVLSITHLTFVGSNSHMEQLAERLKKPLICVNKGICDSNMRQAMAAI